MWFNFERVFGAGLEETEEVLDDGGGSVVAVEVDKTLSIHWWCVNECGLLRIIDEIASVDA